MSTRSVYEGYAGMNLRIEQSNFLIDNKSAVKFSDFINHQRAPP